MTDEVTAADLVAKIESLTSDVAAIEAGYARNALAAESGDREAEQNMVYGAAELQRLKTLIERKKLALAAARQRDREEASKSAAQRILERIEVECRIGEECVETVARIEAHLDAVVDELKILADSHAAYGPTLPSYLVDVGVALPALVNHALSDSGVFGFGARRAGFNTTTGGVRIDAKLTDAYPAASFFVQTKRAAA